jgi:hypothetical protein
MSPGLFIPSPTTLLLSPCEGALFVLGFVVSITIISFKSWGKEERNMSNNYRVHYKRGDLEIEVESSDKNYVDQILHKFVPLSPTPSERPRKGKGKGEGRPKKARLTGVRLV